MAALWKRGAGLIDSRDFQTARAAYEEEMFRLVLEAQIFEFETISSL
jgi:hypothetical protein